MIVKGLILLGSVVAGGAVLAAAPVLTVSAPFWGIMGTTYTVNGVALAGAAAAAATGAGLGKVAGQTGGGIVIEGLNEVSENLMAKLRKKKT